MKIKTNKFKKIRRKLSFNNSTHLILRLKTNMPPMFDPNDRLLRHSIFKVANKYNIKIYDLVFNHSHIHSVLMLPNRIAYIRFIREVTSFIINHVNNEYKFLRIKFRQIFSSRPFTRSVAWGRAFHILKNYMRKNEQESGTKQAQINIELSNLFRDQYGQTEFII